MKKAIAHLDTKVGDFARHPFFAFLRDSSVPARKRFTFVRCVAPWVLGFSDLCADTLCEEPTSDPFQQMVNVHAREDDGHWRWFLEDVTALGEDPELRFTDAVRFLWGSATRETRRLTYRLVTLGANASSIERIVLVEAIEGANKVALLAARQAAADLEREEGRRLSYFGDKHNAVEDEHSLDGDEARAVLLATTLSETQRTTLLSLIDEVFVNFTASMDELLRFSTR